MREDIRKELLDIAPHLAEIGNRNPFVVPEGYFEDLSVGNAAEGNTREASKMPAGYFETLHGEIMSKVAKPEAKVITMQRKWWSVAASVAVICCAGYLFTTLSVPPLDTLAQVEEEIDVDESIDYLMTTGGLYTSELTDLIDEVDFDLMGLDVGTDAEVEYMLTDAELELLEELL